MRATVIVLTSVLVVGCGGAVDGPGLQLSESSVNGGTPSADGTSTCFTQTGAIYNSTAGLNPWGSGRGYIIYGGPTTGTVNGVVVNTNVYLVVGLDSTRTTVVWMLQVLGVENVTPLLNLPGTIPMMCPRDPEAGHVGAGNTNTGGGGFCGDGPCPPTTTYCFLDSVISEWQTSCACTDTRAAACARVGYSCGAVRDRCGNSVNCGSCGYHMSCSAGSCTCTPHTCPKGSYATDDCGCAPGLPI
jgi:hypothetical protein